ncbi:MAG: hypothetical protein QM597_02420 [Aeromicrobium sp.]
MSATSTYPHLSRPPSAAEFAVGNERLDVKAHRSIGHYLVFVGQVTEVRR